MKYNVIDAQLDYLDTSLHFTREVSCFATLENKIISSTTSQSGGAVEFDFFSIWDFLKSQSKMPEQVFMIHSHPEGFNRMSGTDRNMVYGWCLALYVPIWFLVLTEEEITTYHCFVDKATKKVERNLVDVLRYEDACVELEFLARIIYGMSKAREISQDNINSVVSTVNESKLDWQQIHLWSLWHQNVYMELS